MTLAQSEYPFLDLIWTMLVFFGWVIWFWLLVVIFGDLFRRSDVSGWGKAGWTVLVLVLPFLGVLIYLVAQGRHMGERRRAEAVAAQNQFDDYVRDVAHGGGGNGAASQIAEAKKLLDSGAIDDREYQDLKAKALAR
ncbi:MULTISPECIES: SHOCT domain-containing protein [Amycolatopsis]|uniref:SHOCT domain-containing protein n=1 Tax=Amycolatopsis tucumanensis TaxID=401106 RepID=A0ABP7HNX0_9PSEU|nr:MULTISPECIES: SHOCT domain-containing protein [Amycolatopsis]MCF6420690.1 SHOCT domain-containing protein [Amycolatopsis tucumanensis]